MSRLKITLRSDLCSASGDGFSSLIDTDVSYDKFGFPFIGGRRLKGCLKEAAENINSPFISEIFGTSGSSQPGALSISDARLENIEKLREEAVSDNFLTTDKIVSLFTYTRASTAIENDTALENSLRFTRVIRHFSPFSEGEELSFFADVNIDQRYKDEFNCICKALRNIGYKRNRGFGAVSCEFLCDDNDRCDVKFGSVSGDELEISYTIRLDANIIIASGASDETADFIPGTSVLGSLAGEYLKTPGNSADEQFENIFLRDNVRFSNLYISDAENHDFFPVPVIVGKVKGESSFYNILRYDSSDEARIIKPMKSGYCDKSLNIAKPLTETIYHHSTGENSTLYTQTSLGSGQYFRGTISGKAEYIRIICDLMKKWNVRLGKSRSAQYSGCTITDARLDTVSESTVKVDNGSHFIVLALSDLLIPDNMGGYDLSKESIQNALGLDGMEIDKGLPRVCSALRYRTVSGYNSTWNLKKPHIRAIAAGSTLVFQADKPMTFNQIQYIGSKQNEGFGKIMIIPADDIAQQSGSGIKSHQTTADKGELAGLIAKTQLMENIRMKAVKFVEEQKKVYNNLEKAQVGRCVLMVKSVTDYKELDSILNEKSKKDPEDNSKSPSKPAIMKKLVDAAYSQLSGKAEQDLWKQYMLLILTLIKYRKRGGQQNDK